MAGRVRQWVRTPKGLLGAVFLPLLVLAGTAAGWGAALPHVAVALAGACLVELLVTWAGQGTWRWPSSALLSGLIVAFVLEPQTPWAVTFAVAGLATASKYLLATRRGHVFNPAALALLVSIPLFGTGQSWWGALPDLPWPFLLLLLVGGAVVVDRINKFPLVLSFLGTYFGLFTLLALVQPAAVAAMFRAPFVHAALFLALFMLTDPPTSPGRDLEQVWVGGLVAVVACVAQVLGAGQAYLLIGLLAGNAALAVRRWSGGSVPPAVSDSSEPGARRALAGLDRDPEATDDDAITAPSAQQPGSRAEAGADDLLGAVRAQLLRPRTLLAVGGALVVLASLARGVLHLDLAEIWDAVRGANPALVAIALSVCYTAFLARALRWRLPGLGPHPRPGPARRAGQERHRPRGSCAPRQRLCGPHYKTPVRPN